MIKNSYLAALLLILTFNISAFAQTEDEGIKATINQLFDGMRKGDSSLVRTAFSPTAVIQTILKNKEGKVLVRTEPVDSFVAFVGKPHKDVYDERISFSMIKVDAELGFAWTPYQFYVNEKFSHCGVNSFQLVKINGTWKIQYIIDNRRKQGCEN